MPYSSTGIINGVNYLNGVFQYAGWASDPQKTFPKFNPSTEDLLGHFPLTSQETVCRAVNDAKKAQVAWKKLSRIKRAEYFDKLLGIMNGMKDAIVQAISRETGKTLNESNAEFVEAVHMIQYTFAQGREPYGKFIASEIAEKDITVLRKPKGVVAVIAPWNFPFAIPFWCSAPALLEGNTVVFKPSEDTPFVGELIANLYHQAGFPEATFQLVQGDGNTGKALVESDVNHICFTGSAGVGRSIRQHCATQINKTCSCEMGSKSAVIVFADCASELAVQASLTSAFKLSGQRCVSAGRILIEGKIYADFCERFTDAAKKIKIGDPFNEPDAFFGPLINEAQFERVQSFNKKTLDRTDVFLEGSRLERKGFYLTPHIYGCDWKYAHEEDEHRIPSHPFLRQEVFGPHVALIPFNDADDAVRIYNDTDYGLSCAVLTNNMSIARYMRDNCDFGLGYHNLPGVGAESHLPFGGVKASGYGGSSAAGSFHAVTHEVSWTANFDQSGFQMAQGLK